ncbi:MAG TPA: MEDS domain-containing protein, partial [Solirubrobacteraceae bacterium]|nr:MEDS domain-containing protein [Solirubrobacteraceae bacterium]
MAVEMRETMVGGGEHVVQFYDRADDLSLAVGAYLIAAVNAGQVAIVIATEPHRVAFEDDMARAGVDTTQVRCDGSVIWLDAADTLERFMRDGNVDPQGFQEVVGSVVRAAAQTGREIRAYGEMVALLWDAGHVLGAIELEKLWNSLAVELSFSLFCAYHVHSVAGDEHADALREVCRLHT